jgi:PIN domain nuclease of toxin-antitoxin system
VTVLDANALIAVIRGEAAMDRVLAILREGSAAITATNLAEVYDVVSRQAGLPHRRIADVVDPLLAGPLRPIAVDAELARRAAEIRSAHYHRSRQPLSLADSTLLAAPGAADKIASSDAAVLAVAAELGIETIELPPSSG